MIDKFELDGRFGETASSHAVRVRLGSHELVTTSGLIAADAAGQPVAADDPAAQAEYVFELLQHVLRAASVALRDVIQVRLYLTDMQHWPAVAAVRDRMFGRIKPACSVLEVDKTLVEGCDVLLEVSAAKFHDHSSE